MLVAEPSVTSTVHSPWRDDVIHWSIGTSYTSPEAGSSALLSTAAVRRPPQPPTRLDSSLVALNDHETTVLRLKGGDHESHVVLDAVDRVCDDCVGCRWTKPGDCRFYFAPLD